MASQDTSAAERPRLSYRDNLNVLVGKKELKFVVHEATAAANSFLIREACAETLKTDTRNQKTIRLPLVTVETFEIYLHWLHTGDIDLDLMVPMQENDEKNSKRCWKAMKIYLAAEYLVDLKFCNTIMDEMIRQVEARKMAVGLSTIMLVFKHSTPNSKLRAFVIELTVQNIDVSLLEKRRNKISEELVFELMYGILRAGNGNALKHGPEDRCRYHVHNGEVPQCTRGSPRAE